MSKTKEDPKAQKAKAGKSALKNSTALKMANQQNPEEAQLITEPAALPKKRCAATRPRGASLIDEKGASSSAQSPAKS